MMGWKRLSDIYDDDLNVTNLRKRSYIVFDQSHQCTGGHRVLKPQGNVVDKFAQILFRFTGDKY